MTKRIVPFVLLALLSCRRDQQQPLAQPEPTSESSTDVEALARQQDAIVRQQDVIIAQQGELISELRALRQQLGGGEGDIGAPSERAPERPTTRPGQPDKAAIYKVPV